MEEQISKTRESYDAYFDEKTIYKLLDCMKVIVVGVQSVKKCPRTHFETEKLFLETSFDDLNFFSNARWTSLQGCIQGFPKILNFFGIAKEIVKV